MRVCGRVAPLVTECHKTDYDTTVYTDSRVMRNLRGCCGVSLQLGLPPSFVPLDFLFMEAVDSEHFVELAVPNPNPPPEPVAELLL